MLRGKLSINLLGFLLFTFLLTFLQIEIAAQCDGTYFKKLSTTLVPINGIMSASADMTGDGVPDLIGVETNTQQITYDKFIILPSNGSGGFGSPITFNTDGNTNYRYAVGDFDNDNYKDIITTHYLKYRVYRNNGDGTFTAQTMVENGEVIIPLYLMDINSDGKGDFISQKQGGVYYELGNGDGTFQSRVRITTKPVVLPGDFNGDGKTDFTDGSDLFLSQGNGTFTTVSNAMTPGTNESIADARDYTGDGKADVVTMTRTSPFGKVSFLKNTGSNSFQRTDFPIGDSGVPFDLNAFITAGNFSGNSSPDFIYGGPEYRYTFIYTNDGAGNFSRQTYDYRFNAILNPDFVNFKTIGTLTGDFDSDGKTDIVRASNGNTYGSIHKLFNELTVTTQKNVCNPVGQSRILDYNGSGATDYSYWTPSNGRWIFLPSEPPFTLTYSVSWGSASNGDIPAPGDFDGDGKTDRTVYRNSTGVWWTLRTSDQQPSAVQFGITGDIPVVGDYDGDGISDIAVWRPSDGNWYILFLGTQSYTIAHWGQDGDKPIPADYDGDGKTDLAIFRPSTGSWYVLQSSDLNFFALQWGLGTDKPVATDYDGDGKADIAVYRESNNVLHILRSYNLGYLPILYGSAGDIPQPGDFDGDFVADFAVYRPSPGSWYVFYNSAPVNFGAASVVPISSMPRIQ